MTVALAVAALASITSVAGAAVDPDDLSVRVSGNRLVDGSGSPLVLRGVNVSGTEFACSQGGTPDRRGWSIYGGQPLDQVATFEAVARWGANAVRVPLNDHCWLGVNGIAPEYGGVAYREAIEAEVAAIHAAGLYAVLDLHWSAPGPWAAQAQQAMADVDHSLEFWHSVADTFRDDPAVVFDLYNEPYFHWTSPQAPDEWQCWQRGCEITQVVSARQSTASGATTGDTAPYRWRSAGMQQLVDAVRSTGATQPVVVNGTDWGNDLSGWLRHRPSDPTGQVIAGWHSYPDQPCATRSCWDSVIAPIARRVPVLVGETGDSTAGGASYLASLLPWADEHGLSYLAWAWNPWGHPGSVLTTSWDGTPTPGYGAFYRQHLQSAPPPPVSGAAAPPATAGTPGAEESRAVTLTAAALGTIGLVAAALWVRVFTRSLGRRVPEPSPSALSRNVVPLVVPRQGRGHPPSRADVTTTPTTDGGHAP